MRKLVLLSIIVATIAVPLYFSKDPSPARAYKRTMITMAIVVFLWCVLLRYAYFAFSG